MTTQCPQCGLLDSLPSARELGLRRTGKLVYAALHDPAGISLDALRKAAWPDARQRKSMSDGAITIMIKRLDHRLARHGLAIARLGYAYEDRYYKLVGL